MRADIGVGVNAVINVDPPNGPSNATGSLGGVAQAFFDDLFLTGPNATITRPFSIPFSGIFGYTVDLVGPEEVTGPGTAEVWSKALGREIKYGGDDLEAWEQTNLAYLPAWQVFDFKMMYAFFQKHGLKASKEAIARQTQLLGHPPRAFADFAAETAKGWKS